MTTATAGRVARHALPILHDLKRAAAEYEQACRLDALDGYRPHYCPHGMNLWTDYDPICGWCEEGATIYEQALALARTRLAALDRRMAILASAATERAPQHIIDALSVWTVGALNGR